MKTNFLTSALLVCLLGTTTGCSKLVRDPRLIIAPTIRHEINVVNLENRPSKSGTMEMVAQVENKDRGEKQELEYRVEWFEQSGFPIQTVTSRWNFFSLLPGSRYTIESVAPEPDATHYRLHIKEANR